MLRLGPQLLCTLAEKALAEIIAMDPAALTKLHRLAGRQLAFQLTEFDWRLVLTATRQTILLNLHAEPVDCSIQADLVSLQQLRDPNQLTHLIKQEAVQIEGDIQVAQQFSSFFQQLQPDWEAKAASYLGDGLTHKLQRLLQQLIALIGAKSRELQQMSRELVQDELQLTPSNYELEQFSAEVSQLHARLEQLQYQLKQWQE